MELEMQMILSHRVGAENWTWDPPEKQLVVLTTAIFSHPLLQKKIISFL